MIEIRVSVSDVNYDAALETLLPVVIDHLAKKKSPVIAAILHKIKGVSVKTARGILKTLPQKTQDELAVVCLNHFSGNLANLVTKAAKEQGIDLTISEVTVTNQEP